MLSATVNISPSLEQKLKSFESLTKDQGEFGYFVDDVSPELRTKDGRLIPEIMEYRHDFASAGITPPPSWLGAGDDGQLKVGPRYQPWAFMRASIAKIRGEGKIGGFLREGIKSGPNAMWDMLGAYVSGTILESINGIPGPSLQRSTIKKKLRMGVASPHEILREQGNLKNPGNIKSRVTKRTK